MPETFTEEEKKLIEPFFTNLDRNTFALKNLPEVVKGALFSRYSRSTKSLRRILLDEFINRPEMGFGAIAGQRPPSEDVVAIRKAEEFYDRILVGFGDDSVGELGGAHVAVENVSMIAAKALEDSRLGISPLEKSTRYVRFDDRGGGKWKYCLEPNLMASEFSGLYVATCDMLFSFYSSLVEPMLEYVRQRYPLEEFEFFSPGENKIMKFREMADEALKKRAQAAYNSSVKAFALDVIRVILPASTLTNLGLYGNGRAFEYLLVKMHANNLSEIRNTAKDMQDELMKCIPSFVKRADDMYGKMFQKYLAETSENIENIARTIGPSIGGREVELVEYDREGEKKIAAAILYSKSHLDMKKAREIVSGMGEEGIRELITKYLEKRQNRRHKAGRALEHASYTFDMLADFGIYRDLHRHRMLTQERQLLTCLHGYAVPKEIKEAGFEKQFTEVMEKAKEAWQQIYQKYPEEGQYVVPMAYRVRWHMRMSLREAFHMIELRTMPQGHESYRRVCREMYHRIKEVHPFLAGQMKFADLNEYFLGRMKSELRNEEKREKFQ